MAGIVDYSSPLEKVMSPVNEVNPSVNIEENPQYAPKTHSSGRQIIAMSKGRAMKNLLVVSTSYLLFFLGFWALSNLESTINSSGGLGTESQAVIYAVSMVSALFLPELVVKTVGCKWTFVGTLLISCLYIAANMYVSSATMIPGAVLFGLASGPLNTAQAIYVEEMAVRYTKESPGQSLEHVMANFFGIFQIFSESTQIFGNIASYFVLNMGSVSFNSSSRACGMAFRPGNETNHNLDPPSDQKRYILIGTYLLCGVLAAVFMAVFADPLQNDTEKMSRKKRLKSVCDRVWSAVKLHRNPKQFLMIPLTIFIGIEGAVYNADFTQAYIACAWGISHVGFVSICYGVTGALTSLCVGPFVKRFSQPALLLLGATISGATFVTLFLWQPSPDQYVAFFAIAGAWGMCDAIWWSQVPALYGLMFPNDREAAFSNLYFWSSLGFLINYSYANSFSIVVKISIMIGLLLIGVAGFLLCQLKIRRSAGKEYVDLKHDE